MATAKISTAPLRPLPSPLPSSLPSSLPSPLPSPLPPPLPSSGGASARTPHSAALLAAATWDKNTTATSRNRCTFSQAHRSPSGDSLRGGANPLPSLSGPTLPAKLPPFLLPAPSPPPSSFSALAPDFRGTTGGAENDGRGRGCRDGLSVRAPRAALLAAPATLLAGIFGPVPRYPLRRRPDLNPDPETETWKLPGPGFPSPRFPETENRSGGKISALGVAATAGQHAAEDLNGLAQTLVAVRAVLLWVVVFAVLLPVTAAAALCHICRMDAAVPRSRRRQRTSHTSGTPSMSSPSTSSPTRARTPARRARPRRGALGDSHRRRRERCASGAGARLASAIVALFVGGGGQQVCVEAAAKGLLTDGEFKAA